MARVRFECSEGYYLDNSDQQEIEKLLDQILDIAQREKKVPGGSYIV